MMASLPSGFREDVELVHIETEQLSLIIKGKPYHARYEGLMQYRIMDFHDVMKFFVHGEGIQEIKVFDINEGDLTFSEELRPIFFENGIYQLIVVPKSEIELTFYHEHPILRQAVSPVKIGNQRILMGNLQFQNEVGFTTFEIRSGTNSLLAVTLEIYPVKLDYKKDYLKLLEEVNDEIYNLAYHFIRKTYLGARVKLEGNPSRSEFFRLITKHFQQFIQAIRRIELQPHLQLQTTHEKVRGDQLRKQDSTSRNFLRKRSHLFMEVRNGIVLDQEQIMPTVGLRIKKELTYDTIENRYVKWMIGRLIDKLTNLLEALQNENKRWRETPDPDLIDRIEGMKKQLESIVNKVFWKRIGKLDRSVMSLVLQMAPGYRDAFQLYLTVSKGLMLQGKLYQMSVKDVATLYEYWTFLKLGQILGRKYKLLSQDIVRVSNDGLFVNLEKNRKAERVFEHPVTHEKIVLTYQKYEGNLPTIPQKPDTMLSISKKGKDYSYNYIFDAKYRIDYAQEGSSYKSKYKKPGPLEDDINTMHRYRDAIVAANAQSYERTSFGAYVLFPWFDENTFQEHYFYKSINEVNIGGLPFLPNANTLVEKFVENLINKSPEEIQKEGILPMGTLEEWQANREEKVLVGLVSTNEDYSHFVQQSCYIMDVSRLKKGWQEAGYVALYLKSGVTSINGVAMYGKINEVLLEEEKVKFVVHLWHNLSPVIKPVNYGIASYMMTTMTSLLEAEELPELFMKSKDEMVLWRMLRRVSDRIRVDLDVVNVDQALRVKNYMIKDITVTINLEEREISFVDDSMQRVVSLEQLDRNPSAVFRVLLGMLSH